MPGLLRCPRCGAGNPLDAEWCGQCLTRFDAPAGSSAAAKVGPPVELPEIARSNGHPTWTCPACETPNPIEAESCSRCGSSFNSFLARNQERPAPAVQPGRAVVLSAILPGLGHLTLGHAGLAAARALLYVWTLGLSLLLLIRPPASGGAVVRLVAVVFLIAAAGVWILSMMETMRLVEGDPRPVIPAKALTWVAAGLSVLLVVGLLGSALSGRAAP
ncbi:MAG: double zinc ribbon domain-containing protein [Actinomycetota bacterium]